MSAVTYNEAVEAHFKRKVEARINELGRSIAAGAMPSFEQYKWNCGVIKGLQDSILLMEDSLMEIQKAARGEQTNG